MKKMPKKRTSIHPLTGGLWRCFTVIWPNYHSVTMENPERRWRADHIIPSSNKKTCCSRENPWVSAALRSTKLFDPVVHDQPVSLIFLDLKQVFRCRRWGLDTWILGCSDQNLCGYVKLYLFIWIKWSNHTYLLLNRVAWSSLHQLHLDFSS